MKNPFSFGESIPSFRELPFEQLENSVTEYCRSSDVVEADAAGATGMAAAPGLKH
jgi:hypothetical protein